MLRLSFGFCAVLIATAAPVAADHQPVLVVPGRPDLPVMINGVNAAWGYVDGDWGLYRPGAPPLYVLPAYPITPGMRSGGYFPSAGHAPRSGRLEIEPPADRPLPPRAPSFHRSWGAASEPAPATIPPENPPPIIVAPTVDFDGRRRHRP